MKLGFVMRAYQDLQTHLNRSRHLTGSLDSISGSTSSGISLFLMFAVFLGPLYLSIISQCLSAGGFCLRPLCLVTQLMHEKPNLLF